MSFEEPPHVSLKNIGLNWQAFSCDLRTESTGDWVTYVLINQEIELFVATLRARSLSGYEDLV